MVNFTKIMLQITNQIYIFANVNIKNILLSLFLSEYKYRIKNQTN
jgi:hypothetical protein